MAHLSHRVESFAHEDGAPPFARMIPGASQVPIGNFAVRKLRPKDGLRIVETLVNPKPGSPARRWDWLKWFLPQPDTESSFALYRQVLRDFGVLILMCGLPSLVSSRWGLPWPGIAIYPVLVTLFAFSEGLYNQDPPWRTRIPVLIRSVTVPLLLLFITVWQEVWAPALVVTMSMGAAGLVVSHRFMREQLRGREESRNVLIVGATPAGRAIARSLREDRLHRSTVRGFVDDWAPLSPEVLGRVEDLDWLARSEFIDEVIVTLPGESAPAREAAQAAYRNRLDLRVVPDIPAGFWPEANVDRIGGIPVVTLHRESMPAWRLLVKRGVDCVGSAFGLLLASPVMVAVAIAIRIDSPGPVIYAAHRAGIKGRAFRCYKFRSMVADADEKKQSLQARNQREGPIFKLEDDPRITCVGRFLRRYSLDELPQLWNVLCGDMSLVGPRPHPMDEVSRYEVDHFRRLDMKPGLTGLWQVTARKDPSFNLNMHLDLTYIDNWTLLLDFRILMRTFRVLFVPEGA